MWGRFGTATEARTWYQGQMAEGFPDDFLWGVATSAYQIEGAVAEDGRRPSTWDTFCTQEATIADGSSGEIACDHYHRYAEDITLIAGLGAGAYEFSISWPRVVPTGTGAVNAAGLDFYDRLVDALCAAGVNPVATLYHWDTPQPLEDAGGWLNRDTTARFAEYAGVLAERLADRVHLWVTLNEPTMLTFLGYATGVHAPGQRLLFGALPAAHHQLLAHGLAVQALRANGCRAVGIVNNHMPVWPASDSEQDRGAAEAYDMIFNRLFADPVLTGAYPAPELAGLLPGPVADDLAVIGAPLDFYGVNYYLPSRVGAPTGSTAAPPVSGLALPPDLPFALLDIDGYDKTGFGWPVVPDGLREVLVTLKQRYAATLPPVYITENGCSYDDSVHDARRIAYHEGHLAALREAMAAGVDVRGYFVWSLMDNFEWAEGYTQRFGLVHVDYETQARTPKDSYHWYREFIAR